MPLTRKGAKILEHMRSEYGAKKGTSVFYASANKGTIKGVHGGRKPVHHSPFHGKVTGPAIDADGDAADREDAADLAKEVGGELRNTPGLEARRRQVRAAAQDVDPAAEAKAEAGMVMGGSAGEPSHRELTSAVHGLNRQRRHAAGRPMYDAKGRFIGNTP